MHGPKPSLTAFSSPDGYERFLGALPPRVDQSGRVLYGVPSLQTAVPLIPRSQWKVFNRRLKSIPVLDQNGFGACVGYATATAVMKARAKSGMTFQHLSPCFIYALGNGNRDAGMVISDAADIIKKFGVCLNSEVPDGQIWKRDISQAAYQTAKSRFLAMDVYACHSFDELCTAMQLGWDVVLGVNVGTNFNNLDRDGVPGGGFTRGGHALTDSEEMKLSSRNDWLVGIRNSWSKAWGLGGFCYFNERTFDGGYFDAFAIRSVMTDPQETNTGKPLIIH